MKLLCRLVLFAALGCLGQAAVAADGAPAEGLHWRCWYDQGTHVTCLIDALPAEAAPPPLDLPANLPPLVRTLRLDPAALGGKVIHIPLYTEPYDMEFTAQLAGATVCGSRPGCTVEFTEKLPPLQEILAIFDRFAPGLDDGTALALLEDTEDGL